MDKARLEARLKLALEAMRPAMKEVLDIAHELADLQDVSEEEAYFDRIMQLGWVTEGAADMCTPGLHVLNDVIRDLMAHGEEEEADSPSVQH